MCGRGGAVCGGGGEEVDVGGGWLFLSLLLDRGLTENTPAHKDSVLLPAGALLCGRWLFWNEKNRARSCFLAHTFHLVFFFSLPRSLDLLVSPLWRAPPLSCWPCAWPCAWRWRPPVSEGLGDEKKRHARAPIVVCCGCAGRSRERLRGDDQHTPDAVNARLMPETGVEWAAGGVARRGEGPILFLGLPRPPSLLF